MEKSTLTDFIEASNGNCFFCLQNNISPVSYESLPGGKYQYNPSLHSLQYLYRYLGMSIGGIPNLSPLNFTQTAQGQRVKVYLCEDCANENELFGKLYQQLEKIQMELMSRLETIHMKLASGDDARENSQPAHHQLSLTNDLNDKLKLAQALRIKTTEKCYFKLKNELPRILVRKLSAKVLRTSLANKNSTALKNIRNLRTDLVNRHTESNSADAAVVKVEYVKVENSTAEDEMPDESGNSDWFDDDTNSTSEGEDVQQLKLPAETENDKNEMTTEGEGANQVGGGYSYVIIKADKQDEDLLKPLNMQSIVDHKTKTHRCRVCSRKFVLLKSFENHYKCKHLNERYKCTFPGCGKIFNFISNFYVHNRQMHVGIKIFCKICKKGFGTKHNLGRHHRTTSCGKGLAPTPVKYSCHCRICGKGFNGCEGTIEQPICNNTGSNAICVG